MIVKSACFLLLHDQAQIGVRADDAQVHILVGVEADAFEAEANGEIRGSGDRMVGADFSFQILDGFDVRLCDQIVWQENFEAHHHAHIGAAHFSAGDGRSGAGDDMKLAGKQRHERLRRAFDVNDIDVEVMLFENAGIFGDPKHR